MYKIGATVIKELLLVSRDRAGMLVLFLMPALLVLVITHIQENIMKTMGEKSTRILIVDKEQQLLGQTVEQRLLESGMVEIIKKIDGKKVDEKKAIKAVVDGDFQLCIIIPEGMTQSVKKKARQVVKKSLSLDNTSTGEKIQNHDIAVYFDPTILGGFRSAILNSLKLIILTIEINEKMKALSELLPEHINTAIQKEIGSFAPDNLIKDIPEIKLDFNNGPLLGVTENQASRDAFVKKPNSVQQNVPAWALFGIFFIVVPMAGGLIKERHDETLSRLLSMPVSYLSLITGKVIAYVLLCLIQFGLILLIGKFLLPLLGSPMLEMGSDPVAVIVIALSAILAATGYGILLGTVARTYEQASMFGPISIVIAAALGGIMVPVYAMPKIMQQISVVSPLAWGLDAFLEIFVRGGNITTVLMEVCLLISFFIITMLISWVYFFRRTRNGF
ncbi:MAG: ABC transporter permease [Thermodesulfobacteriota bacterium]|nr:ABC transporter permease [Thermodesulfobacteriota bacterium]